MIMYPSRKKHTLSSKYFVASTGTITNYNNTGQYPSLPTSLTQITQLFDLGYGLPLHQMQSKLYNNYYL